MVYLHTYTDTCYGAGVGMQQQSSAVQRNTIASSAPAASAIAQCGHMPINMLMFVFVAGPSQCFAITVMQPPEGGKTLSTRPAYKGIIRAQLPSMCPLGALFRWLATRFAIEGESLPTPGHPQWQSFLLWPGRAGGWLSCGLSCGLCAAVIPAVSQCCCLLLLPQFLLQLLQLLLLLLLNLSYMLPVVVGRFARICSQHQCSCSHFSVVWLCCCCCCSC